MTVGQVEYRRSLYSAYKAICLEWLAEIPVHWRVVSLKSVADVAASNVDKKSYPEQTSVRLCNYTDVYYSDVIDESVAFMEATATTAQVARFELRAGDVLITKDSESWDDIGVPAYIVNDLPGVLCGYHLYRIRPGFDLFGRYLAYWIGAHGPSVQYKIAANGITRFGIGGQSVKDSLIAIPSVVEQRAIAAFLDRETAKIDTLIEKKEKLIELLAEKRKALITRAVTKGLDPKVPMKDSGAEWLGAVPEHWGIHRAGGLFRDTDDRGHPELPILEVSIARGVQLREFSSEHINQQAEDRSVYKRAEVDDIVFNKMRLWQGAIGRCPTDGLVSPDYTVARPKPDLDANYYGMLFRTTSFADEANRRSYGIHRDRNRLYWDGFKLIMVPTPPVNEQREIAAAVSFESSRIDTLTAKVREAIDRLKEYRTALISAAVTGKIDVRGAA